jgi:hypothetical protein
MLKVRAEQMQAFERSAWRAFEDEMIAHSKDFAPTLCTVIGDAQVRLAVRHMIARAGTYNLTLRGPIRLCVELMFLCGSAFDTDPQYPGFGDCLRSSNSEMRRADQLQAAHNEYLEAVAGPDNINIHNAERAIADYARRPTVVSEPQLEAELIGEMTRSFPQRTAYIGEAALRELVTEGRQEARKHRFTTPRGQALVVILMSAFGHGCTSDPLYPWISQTLTDPMIVDAAARADRLERKSLTWLEHVLARLPQVGLA